MCTYTFLTRSSALFISRPRTPTSSTLFPYTTLFRSVYDNLDYLPFGEQIAGSSVTTHKFTGYESDSESSLDYARSEEHTSELQSPYDLVCRLLLEKKKNEQHVAALSATGGTPDICED